MDFGTKKYLCNFRWAIFALQLGIIFYTVSPIDFAALSFSSIALFLILSFTFFSNILLQKTRPELFSKYTLPTLMLGIDVGIFCGILHLTGNIANPFSIVFLLYVVVAAITLGVAQLTLITTLSILAFGSLLITGNHQGVHGHHEGFESHLIGMWVAYSLTAIVTAYFISELSTLLRTQIHERELLKQSKMRLASLTTLAAGAAHELATPLNTISILTEELEEKSNNTTSMSEISIIKDQVDKCSAILQKLRGKSGAIDGEALREISVFSLITALERRFTPHLSTIQFLCDRDEFYISVPPRALEQALTYCIDNSLDANPKKSILVLFTADKNNLIIKIRDDGEGIPEEHITRIGEPFFTSKDPGEGLGLGVFLGRLTAEELGGTLRIKSEIGQGTEVTIQLPVLTQWKRYA